MNLVDTLVYWFVLAKNNEEYKWGKDDLRHIRQLIEMVNHGQEKTKRKVGREGEKIIREYLQSIGAKIHQIDWMSLFKDKYRLIEAKHQDIYLPGSNCPFYGTGLPPWQVRARMEFYRRTGIVPYLYVVEKSDYEKKEGYHLIWKQSLPILEATKYKDTESHDSRRVYDIENFNRIYFAKRIS